MVKDVESLWSALNIQATHLLGISMGGMIGQRLAAASKINIKSLILVSTTSSSQWISAAGEDDWGKSIDDVINKLENYFSPSFHENNQILVMSMAKTIMKNIDNGSFAEGAKLQRQGISSVNNLDYLPKIESPTLIIHGLDDAIIDPRAASELDDIIQEYKLKYVDGVGHLLLAEYSKQLYMDVSEFIELQQST